MLDALILAAALTLDTPIQSAMRDANATKLAIVVVQNDKILYQRTFGAEADAPFYLASVPKSFTGLTARLLAQEKKLDLDAPLTTTLPALKLPAPLAQTQFDEDMKKIRERLSSRPQRNAELATKISAETGDSDRTLASYTGTYADELLGTMVVRQENDQLHATIGDRSGQLIRARGDAFYVQWYADDGPDRVTFTKDGLQWSERELKRQ